ncbi:ATPase involved in chromosome partitioning (plasmid) [Desulfosporosinus acidiphilus SJ4]|uniref:ATPase involved in chromosome partitioning n=1 Tax=Desulfosporosinus acidiphilus (strain DSM 22704 / JCM 16185 / SJ4) TaxID=646529 RepID=I4DCU7_DESAJ|nr:ATPase involved in chromosome partitioning [Desulfosporosinus acidiphilus]AFM43621.1 ATPase involved in chromosome partitioning [Desulfosporosinus acidiphilus SJ4]
MAIYFYRVPEPFCLAFGQAGITAVPTTEIPPPASNDTFIWYAKSEEEIMIFQQLEGFGRKIILAPDTLVLENKSVTALLLRQANVELYFPFNAAHIPEVLAPARHWYSPDIVRDTTHRENLPVLFSGSGKDSLAIWGPPSSGKTSLSLAIAAALSRTKAKVLLIDATNNSDLLLWVKDPLSSEVITLAAAYELAKTGTKIKFFQMAPGLFVVPGQPNRKLAPDEFLFLLDSLRNHFDFIMLDTSSLPDEVGSVALQVSSRILLCSTLDLQPFAFWYKSDFSSVSLPFSKMNHVVNAYYQSRSQKRDAILQILNRPILGYIPAQYETVTEGKISATSPYFAGDEEYKDALNSLMSNLWSIRTTLNEDSIINRLRSKFSKGG